MTEFLEILTHGRRLKAQLKGLTLDELQEVIEKMLADGLAYYCYCSVERLDALREEQRARGDKPRYDGKCRDGVANPNPNIKPVIRFRNPTEGERMAVFATGGTRVGDAETGTMSLATILIVFARAKELGPPTTPRDASP